MSKIIISEDKNTITVNGCDFEAIKFERCSTCAFKGFAICHEVQCSPTKENPERNVQFKLKTSQP